MKLKLGKRGKDLISNLGGRTKSVIYGSGVMLVATLVSTLTRVGLIAILARIYTKDEFGLWVAITSATAVLASSDLGIGNSLRNKLAELKVNGISGDIESRKYFFSVLYFFFFVSLALSLGLYFFHDFVNYKDVFKTSDLALQKQGVNILIGVQTIFLLGIPFGIGASSFFVYNESFWVGIQNIVIGLLSLIIIAILALTKADITVVAIVFFLITLFVNICGCMYFIYRRKWQFMNVNFLLMFRRIKHLLRSSLSFALLQISGPFMYNATTLIVTANLSLSNGAEINLVQKLYTFIITIYMSFYNPIWSGYADAIHRKDWAWTKNMLKRTLQISTGIFTIAIIIFVFYGNFFLQLLAGSSYVSNNILFFYLGLWALFYSLYSMGTAFLSATGKINFITIITSLFALIYVSAGNYVTKAFGLSGISLMSAFVFFILTIAAYTHSFLIIKKRLI